jgi:hypothetical protein
LIRQNFREYSNFRSNLRHSNQPTHRTRHFFTRNNLLSHVPHVPGFPRTYFLIPVLSPFFSPTPAVKNVDRSGPSDAPIRLIRRRGLARTSSPLILPPPCFFSGISTTRSLPLHSSASAPLRSSSSPLHSPPLPTPSAAAGEPAPAAPGLDVPVAEARGSFASSRAPAFFSGLPPSAPRDLVSAHLLGLLPVAQLIVGCFWKTGSGA